MLFLDHCLCTAQEKVAKPESFKLRGHSQSTDIETQMTS